MNDIVTVCLASSMVIAVFAFNLRIQAVVIRDQKRAASVVNKEDQAKKFYQMSWYFFASGILSILVALYILLRYGLSGYWITGGITLFALGGTLLVWREKLITENQKKFGENIYLISEVLLGIALVVFFAGILLWLWTIHIPLVLIVLAGIMFLISLLLFFEFTVR